MSLEKCLPGLVADGKLTREQADAAAEVYGRRKRHYERSMAPDTAEALASADAADAVERAAKRRMFLVLRQEKARKALLPSIMTGDKLDAKKLPKTIVRVDLRRRAVEGRAFALIDGILAAHRRTMTGKLRNPAQMDNIVRELFGQDTGDVSAKELADAWRQAGEMLRQRFNAGGGDIGKLEGWGLPQAHDSGKVRRAGWEVWRDAVLPNLDRAKMIDDATGKPFDDEGLEKVLRDVFETIRTDGWASHVPGVASGKKMLANRRAEHRFLHFKDAEAWLAYQKAFGRGSAFDAMMGHVRGMSRDIAAMELFGPNPESTVKWLTEGIEKQAQVMEGDNSRALGHAGSATFRTQRLWDEYTGSLSRPVNRNLALVGGTYRSIASAAKLGTAPISALGDLGTGFATRAFNGLPVHSLLGDYAKLLNPASDEGRRLAIRLGLGAQGWAGMVSTHSRYLLEEMTHETARRVSDFMMRASGLEAMTDAGKWANGLAWLGHLSEESGKSWDEIGGRVQRAFKRYGMGEKDWDAIRATPQEEDGGVDWIKPHNIADQELGDKLLEMIHSEDDFAVPAPDLETRAILHSKARPGTVFGEAMMSGPLLFKSFGVAVMVRHLGRMMEMPTLPGKLGYLTLLTVPLTIAGMASVELHELVKRRDPRPLTDPKLGLAGLVQGGGFGIASDLMNIMAEKRVDGLGQYLAGPLGEDLWNTAGGVFDLVKPIGMEALGMGGRDLDAAYRARQRAPWKLAKVALQDTPGTSLWYLRSMFEANVTDQLHMALSPTYMLDFGRARQAAQRQGQDYYWAPGTRLPQRAPDMSKALAAPPQ
jgi:hypothetical protein